MSATTDLEGFAAWLAVNRRDLPDVWPERDSEDEEDAALLAEMDALDMSMSDVQMRVEGDPEVRYGLLVHFTHDADGVLEHGLLGVDDHRRIGLTWDMDAGPGMSASVGGKTGPGFNFAFEAIGDGSDGWAGEASGYGDEAFVFPAGYVRVWHRGDRQVQAVFLGEEADLSQAVRLRRDAAAGWEQRDEEPSDREEWLVSGREDEGPMTLAEALQAAAEELGHARSPAP